MRTSNAKSASFNMAIFHSYMPIAMDTPKLDLLNSKLPLVLLNGMHPTVRKAMLSYCSYLHHSKYPLLSNPSTDYTVFSISHNLTLLLLFFNLILQLLPHVHPTWIAQFVGLPLIFSYVKSYTSKIFIILILGTDFIYAKSSIATQ